MIDIKASVNVENKNHILGEENRISHPYSLRLSSSLNPTQDEPSSLKFNTEFNCFLEGKEITFLSQPNMQHLLYVGSRLPARGG